MSKKLFRYLLLTMTFIFIKPTLFAMDKKTSEKKDREFLSQLASALKSKAKGFKILEREKTFSDIQPDVVYHFSNTGDELLWDTYSALTPEGKLYFATKTYKPEGIFVEASSIKLDEGERQIEGEAAINLYNLLKNFYENIGKVYSKDTVPAEIIERFDDIQDGNKIRTYTRLSVVKRPVTVKKYLTGSNAGKTEGWVNYPREYLSQEEATNYYRRFEIREENATESSSSISQSVDITASPIPGS